MRSRSNRRACKARVRESELPELRPKRACNKSACSVLVGMVSGRAAALHVANHERQFNRYGETQSFRFQRHSWTRSGCEADGACVSGANRRSDGRDFVFRLKCNHAEIFVHRKLVQNIGCGRYRIRAKKQRNASFLRSGYETQGKCGVATDIAIRPGRKFRGRNLLARSKIASVASQ